MKYGISLGQYLIVVILFVGILTTLGASGVQRYEQDRIETIVDRELSKLEAITEGALQQQLAVQRAQARLISVLEDELRRVVRYGDRQLDTNGRIAIRRAMDSMFNSGAYFSGVELFGTEGQFLIGVEATDTTGLTSRPKYLPHPISQHVTNRALPEQRGLVVYPAELRTRNGIRPETDTAVVYMTEWVRTDAGRPVWLLVTTYDLGPIHSWSHRIADNAPRVQHAIVSNNGKVLVGGERFGALEFAEDRGQPSQRLGDVIPRVWQALQTGLISRYRTQEGLYLRFVHTDSPSIDFAARGGPDASLIFMPTEGLYAGSFFRSLQGQILVVLVYLGMALIAWTLWSQIAARRVLEAKDQALVTSLGRLRHATEFGRLGLLESNVSGDSAYANATFFQMHGVPRPTDRAISLDEIDRLFPGYTALQQQHAAAVTRLISSADPDQTETIDYDYELPDGSTRRYRMVIAVDLSTDTPVLRTLYSDITDLHEQRKALTRAAEQQTSMFKIIAHELRTPAAATHMIAEELSEQVGERSDLLSASGHLLDVIDDLRITVNPDASIESKPMDFMLPTLLQEAERQVRAVFATQSMKLEFEDLPPTERTYCADAYRLRAVLTNLLRNAAYHSQGSAAWVSVDLSTGGEGEDRVRIRVEDDGRGIPADSVERLFDPFERGETNVGGTGVGLHIARSWIELMGGTLAYRTSRQGGACFEIDVSLPWAESALSTVDAKDQKLSVDAWMRGRQVLLVEDDLLIRTATKRLLEKQYAANVTVAEDGEKALQLFAGGAYELIVTDFLMPVMDGLDLIVALRKQGSPIPVMALTAATIGAERDELLAAGADVVVSKPLTGEKLETALADITS